MKSKYSRRYRRSKSPPGEAVMFKKQHRRDDTFFAGPSQQTFFKSNTAIRRKGRLAEADETTLKHTQQIRQGEKAAKTKIKQNIALHFKNAGGAITSFTAYAQGVSDSLTYLNVSMARLAPAVLNTLKIPQGGASVEAGLLPQVIATSVGAINAGTLRDGVPSGASLDKKIKSFLLKLEQTVIGNFEKSSNDWQKQIDAEDLVEKFKNYSAPEKVYSHFERANTEDIKTISRWAGIPDPADFSLFNILSKNLANQFKGWLQNLLANYERNNINAAGVVMFNAMGQEGEPAGDKTQNSRTSTKDVEKSTGPGKDETRASRSKKNKSKL